MSRCILSTSKKLKSGVEVRIFKKSIAILLIDWRSEALKDLQDRLSRLQ